MWQESRGPVPGPITNGNLLDAAGTDPPLPRSDRPGAALAPKPLPAARRAAPRLLAAAIISGCGGEATRIGVLRALTGYSEHSRGTHRVLTGAALPNLERGKHYRGVNEAVWKIFHRYSRGTHGVLTHGVLTHVVLTGYSRCSPLPLQHLRRRAGAPACEAQHLRARRRRLASSRSTATRVL